MAKAIHLVMNMDRMIGRAIREGAGARCKGVAEARPGRDPDDLLS